jgi:hypothetical protein
MEMLSAMRNSAFTLLFLICIGCSKQNANESYTSGETGLTLIDSKSIQCIDGPVRSDVKIMPKGGGYRVYVKDEFRCQDELDAPFLTMTGDTKRTLILSPKKDGAIFNTSCSCARILAVDIKDRLKPGMKLYVLNDREVVDDVIVP